MIFLAKYCQRSHTCGQLRANDVGRKVELYGWIRHIRRFLDGPFFLTLHDSYGSTQILIEKSSSYYKSLENIPTESVVSVLGRVCHRPSNMVNKDMLTGEIEVVVDNLNIVNKAKELPIQVSDKGYKAKEEIKLRYRHVDLRSMNLQTNLRMRSDVVMAMRKFLVDKAGFVEVETPTLFKRTPEGAREFLVPTRHAGQFYTLVQSPQQFKQLLMVGGIDRYFQFARCYRDEDSRSDRQPEFTQLDLEMSFVDKEGIQCLIEDMIQDIWPVTGLDMTFTNPFPRMQFIEAMSNYGSDKPDIRFDMKIKDVTQEVGQFYEVDTDAESSRKALCIVIPGGEQHLTEKNFKEIVKYSRELGENITILRNTKNGEWKGNVSKDLLQNLHLRLGEKTAAVPGDAIILTVGHNLQPNLLLGRLRLLCADLLESIGLQIRDPNDFKFLWIENFPLFTRSEDLESKIESTHHPFTAPIEEDLDSLLIDPLSVRGKHYDLVLNGNEVAGGSIRMHDANLQMKILEKILQVNPSQFEHLLNGLQSGCPPHGGIAIGFDRFIAVLCGVSSLRDVIAFPKSTAGRDLLTGAPSRISNKCLSEYHIRTVEPLE